MTRGLLLLVTILWATSGWAQHAGHTPPPRADTVHEAGAMPMDDDPPAPDAHAAHRHPMTPVAVQSPTTPRVPIPPVTDEMRAAAFPKGVNGHAAHDHAWRSFALVEKFEWRDGHGGGGPVWDFSGWVGGNVDRLWFRSDGALSDSDVAEGDAEIFWGHAVSRWWDTVIGVRHDFAPGSSRTWAAFGVQGLAPQWFEVQLTGYASEQGQFAAVLQSDYDFLITNRLILQPRVDLVAYAQDDRGRGTASGFSDGRFSLRLRYEIRREFAPYVGVEWERSLGDTADLVRATGGTIQETRVVAGVRLWF